nr:MAG TPA: hypothetical protein [Caudoviricetes sp.]
MSTMNNAKKHLTAIRRILKQFKPLYHKNACPHS